MTDEAVISYKRAVELNPDLSESRENIAYLSKEKERLRKPVPSYEKATDSNAQNITRKAEEIRLELLKTQSKVAAQSMKKSVRRNLHLLIKGGRPRRPKHRQAGCGDKPGIVKNRETITNQPRKEERPPEPAPSNEKASVTGNKSAAALYELASSYESSNAKNRPPLRTKKYWLLTRRIKRRKTGWLYF